jgi:flagellar biosynthesis protein FliQ
MRDHGFYLRWIGANCLGEALGLGTTFALGALIAPALGGDTSTATVLTGAVAAVLLGTLLEGVVVGFFQAQVLRRWLPTLPRRAWIVATAIGAGLAWLLGMIPSTIMSLIDRGESAAAYLASASRRRRSVAGWSATGMSRWQPGRPSGLVPGSRPEKGMPCA